MQFLQREKLKKKVYISQLGEKRLKRGQEGRKRNVNSEGVKQVMDPGKKERQVAVWSSEKDATWQGPGLGCFACSQ